MPLGMKRFFSALAGFSAFHTWCCWSASYTAKPVFRAHFASTGDENHRWSVFGGSCCVAFITIVAGWGSGVFSIPASGLDHPLFVLFRVAFAWLMAWGSVLVYGHTSRRLTKDLANIPPSRPMLSRMTLKDFTTWNYRASVILVVVSVLFFICFIVSVQRKLLAENRALT